MFDELYTLIKSEISGSRAKKIATKIYNFDHYYTFSNFRKSAEFCYRKMKEAGLSQVELIEFPYDGETKYGNWIMPQAWDVEEASLEMIFPRRYKLADWKQNPLSLVMYSAPTPKKGIETELIWLKEDKKFNKSELRNKIVFTSQPVRDIYISLGRAGVRGIVTDFLSETKLRKKRDLPNAVYWEENAFKPVNTEKLFAFVISPNQGEYLKRLFKEGKRIKVRAKINSRLYKGKLPVITGVLTARDSSLDEILILSHLFEPGADDNASGAALTLEIARSLNHLIKMGKLSQPKRRIRFLLGWELYGPIAWIYTNQGELSHIIAGLNLDMVGANQKKSKSILRVFQTPHSTPSFVNILLRRLMDEKFSMSLKWEVNGFGGGDCFLSDPLIGIPTPGLWQYPSMFHHTSLDTPGILSPFTLREVGAISATYLYFIANAGLKEACWLAKEIFKETEHEINVLAQSVKTEDVVKKGDKNFSNFIKNSKEKIDYRRDLKIRTLETLLKLVAEDECRILKKYLANLIIKIRNKAEQEKRNIENILKTKIVKGKHKNNKMNNMLELEAKKLVPKRIDLGFPSERRILDNLSPKEREQFLEIRQRNPFPLWPAVYWVDGKKNLLEISKLVREECGKVELDSFVQSFKFLAKHGFIELKENK